MRLGKEIWPISTFAKLYENTNLSYEDPPKKNLEKIGKSNPIEINFQIGEGNHPQPHNPRKKLILFQA
jgi:hypothetical protein